MPELAGFSDNPLRTREDVIAAAKALLEPLTRYFSPDCARVRLPYSTGTHFDETAAQLEGFARPLWVVSALLLGESGDGDAGHELVQQWLDGFETGPDPNHAEYWGDIEDYDQRMVEAETISVALLAIPQHLLWQRLSEAAKKNIVRWLMAMLSRKIHKANWLWFRVFACLALRKTCGVDTPEVRNCMEDDLVTLDTFYLGDGWSGDGLWLTPEQDDEGFEQYQETGIATPPLLPRAACYYSGSFAIQFSQLLYVRFAGDLDPARTERYRQQARDFGRTFGLYFDTDGAVIPFGRSLVYRFACGGFFAALAVAQVPDMPEPLSTPVAIKGYLLRHLRWWARHSRDIFRVDGTLNLGWTYPQAPLTEDYNSPQSVYWSLKSFSCIALGARDDFWTAEEKSHPASRSSLITHTDTPSVSQQPSTASGGDVVLLAKPGQILCNHTRGNHHFLLNAAQFMSVPFRGAQAKYSKFAYSSAFGFSVPTGHDSLSQIAPDSMLALSRDGMQTWAVKGTCDLPVYSLWAVTTREGDQFSTTSESVQVATVKWWPWADRRVVVHTTLIPPTRQWPDWHTRIHRINIAAGSSELESRLFMAEGGFAIHGQQAGNTRPLKVYDSDALTQQSTLGSTEGNFQSELAVLICSEQGASGIVAGRVQSQHQPPVEVEVLKPDPNTNLMRNRTLIPYIRTVITPLGSSTAVSTGVADHEIVLVTKVFAISAEANGRRGLLSTSPTLRERWLDKPQIYGLDDVKYHDSRPYIIPA